jgi:hypothetical protein
MDNLKGFVKLGLWIFVPLITFGFIAEYIQRAVDIPKLFTDILSIIVISGIWIAASLWPILCWGLIVGGAYLLLKDLLTNVVSEALRRNSRV